MPTVFLVEEGDREDEDDAVDGPPAVEERDGAGGPGGEGKLCTVDDGAPCPPNDALGEVGGLHVHNNINTSRNTTLKEEHSFNIAFRKTLWGPMSPK